MACFVSIVTAFIPDSDNLFQFKSQIQDTYEYSNGELAALLGERFRNYRNMLGLSQKDVALGSGVSVMTIVRFETGGALLLAFRKWKFFR